MKKEEKKLILEKLNKEIEEKIKNSILIINKASKRTSADEVYELRRIFKNKERQKEDKIKIGHSGTLDPKVTGILVLGLGKGTKALEYILLSKKVYETEVIFHKKVSRKDFEESLKKFTGKITQLPPVKSAIKRQEREREVYDLKLVSFAGDGRNAKFISSVERGTYIRTLCKDIGEFLEIGAHMGELKRTQAGVFSTKNSKNITTKKFKELYESDKIQDKKELLTYLYAIEELFFRLKKEKIMKSIKINQDSEKYIKAGNPVRIKNIIFEKEDNFIKDEIISIFYENNILAIGMVLKDFKKDIDKEEMEVVKLKKVIV